MKLRLDGAPNEEYVGGYLRSSARRCGGIASQLSVRKGLPARQRRCRGWRCREVVPGRNAPRAAPLTLGTADHDESPRFWRRIDEVLVRAGDLEPLERAAIFRLQAVAVGELDANRAALDFAGRVDWPGEFDLATIDIARAILDKFLLPAAPCSLG